MNFKNSVEKISSSVLEKIAGKISENGTLKINNASVQIVSAEQVSPDKTAYFDGINYRTQDLTFNGDREAKYDFTNNGYPHPATTANTRFQPTGILQTTVPIKTR